MTNATEEPTGADPTLAALVPRRSPLRNTVLTGIAVLVLVAAWTSPAVIRPAIDPSYGGGLGVVGDQVITWRSVEVRSWFGATLEHVEDVPGARVLDAWLVDGDEWIGPDPRTTATDHDDASSYVRAVVGSDRLADRTLPRRTDVDTEQFLVIVWDVDCGALADPTDTVPVHLSTVPGFDRVDHMAIFGLETELLDEEGAC
jgi:hypothetical protein